MHEQQDTVVRMSITLQNERHIIYEFLRIAQATASVTLGAGTSPTQTTSVLILRQEACGS